MRIFSTVSKISEDRNSQMQMLLRGREGERLLNIMTWRMCERQDLAHVHILNIFQIFQQRTVTKDHDSA